VPTSTQTTPTLSSTPTPTATPTPSPSPGTVDAQSLLLLSDHFSGGGELTNSTVPYEILISNISGSSFTLNWRTNEPTTGSVRVKAPAQQLVLDERDSSQASAQKRYTHKVNIPISAITEGTLVEFTPVSNGTDFERNFSFKVPALTSSPPSPENLSGSVAVSFTETNDRDLVVYGRKTSATGKSTWKTQVITTDNFVLPLGDAYSQNLSSYFSAASPGVELRARGEFNSTAATTTQLSETPELELDPGLALTSITHDSALSAVPVFRGTAEPGSSVLLRINSFSNTVTADSTGNWSLGGVQGLAAGQNTIRLESGGNVMGLSFSLNLEDLPATAISDSLPLLFTGVLFVIAGFFLKLKAQRISARSH
jgi:hypothetical protein